MSKNIVFQDSYPVSGVISFDGCKKLIQNFLKVSFEDYKQEKLLPKETRLIINDESNSEIPHLSLAVESEDSFKFATDFHNLLNSHFKENLDLAVKRYKNIIFQDSYLVSGIMCFHDCGNTVQNYLNNCFKEYPFLPKDAQLIIDAEPSLGLQRIFLTVESEEQSFEFPEKFQTLLSSSFEEDISTIKDKVPEQVGEINGTSNKTNWINILINLSAMGLILVLYLVFPPSILLTIGLTAISFFATAFTAREYLINFYHNLRNRNFANMATTISFGWFLSLAHTLFHSISMPLASSFSMIFMSHIMPVMLITFINSMDEIKRLVFKKSQKMNLEGMANLFPQMSKSYICYQLEKNDFASVAKWINKDFEIEKVEVEKLKELKELLNSKTLDSEREKITLRAGMIIEVKKDECFPVDCVLINENTVVDASLLTGEPRQVKKFWDKIPAGAVNLDKTVRVYAVNNSYNSAITRLLFPANREREKKVSETPPKFIYVYTALIIAGVTAAIICPIALGIFSIPFLLQNVIGILFSICPCTIAIALLLPPLISIFHRNKKGIQLRDETVTERTKEFHTIVFDKTGTLTTGDSTVESSYNISTALWQRIYLLEKFQGAEHPLAKAITKYYEANFSTNLIINDLKNGKLDPKIRGISGEVQGVPIHIGNAAFLKESGIELPDLDSSKLKKRFTPVYVAENGIYQGVIYIKHEARQGIEKDLSRLKNENKTLIMVTGDTKESAWAFNKQIGKIFDKSNIYFEQTPEKKEELLLRLLTSPDLAEGTCIVGDGLNDGLAMRTVSEKGGTSCAMNAHDMAVYFTDICLNGSLSYLFGHNKINQFLQKNILQNKTILTASTLAFLAFIIGFSIAGIGVPPLIPLIIMLSTTFLILFDSYRTKLFIDTVLDKHSSWPKKLLASDLSIGLLLLGSGLIICSILISTIATGGLALPLIFTAGGALAFSSCATLAAIISFNAFIILVGSYFVVDDSKDEPITQAITAKQFQTSPGLPSSPGIRNTEAYDFAISKSNQIKAPTEAIEATEEDLATCSFIS